MLSPHQGSHLTVLLLLPLLLLLVVASAASEDLHSAFP
jgi:hypothetical protein